MLEIYMNILFLRFKIYVFVTISTITRWKVRA